MSEHDLHVDDFLQGRPLPNLLHKYLEQGEILLDLLASRWPLYLDDHSLAVRQCRPVDLGDRASGKGGRIDGLKNVLPRHPEFLLRNPDDVALGHRRHMVLQHRELLDVLGRQEVRARRQDLSGFREGGAELLQGGAQTLGLPATAGGTLLVWPAEQLF